MDNQAANNQAAGQQPPFDPWPVRIGVSALTVIALACIAGLFFLSSPAQTTGQQGSTIQTQTGTNQTQEGTNQTSAGDAPSPTDAQAAPNAAATTASTLGVYSQIASVLATIAAACVGGISGLLVPRSGTSTA
jgi:hypothetical protein